MVPIPVVISTHSSPRLPERRTYGILHHKRHQLCRVPTDIEELDPVFLHKFLERRVSRQPNAVSPLFREHLCNRHKRLHVAPTPDNHHDDIEPRRRAYLFLLFLRLPRAASIGQKRLTNATQEHAQRALLQLIEVDVDAPVVVDEGARVELVMCDVEVRGLRLRAVASGEEMKALVGGNVAGPRLRGGHCWRRVWANMRVNKILRREGQLYRKEHSSSRKVVVGYFPTDVISA